LQDLTQNCYLWNISFSPQGTYTHNSYFISLNDSIRSEASTAAYWCLLTWQPFIEQLQLLLAAFYRVLQLLPAAFYRAAAASSE